MPERNNGTGNENGSDHCTQNDEHLMGRRKEEAFVLRFQSN